MNSKDYTKIIMNPVRMRIIQYLILHSTGTAAQIGEALSDVPRASLYRHMKTLENAGLLLIVQENRKRGTIEKVYRLNQDPVMGGCPPDKAQLENMLQGVFLSIMSDFRRYFESENVDLVKDQLSLSSSTLLLSDEEFTDFLNKLGTLFNDVISNRPNELRRPRRITFISSPIQLTGDAGEENNAGD